MTNATRVLEESSLVFSLLGLPLMSVLWLWLGSPKRGRDWLFRLLCVGALVVYGFVAGGWDWIGYPWRFVPVTAFVPVALASWRKARDLPWTLWTSWGTWWFNALLIVLSLSFGVFFGLSVLAQFAPPRPVNLEFPLRTGVYYVRQGGSNSVLNYHSVSESQRYALDITRLGGLGARAKGMYPTELSRYWIFGQSVYAPCSGHILEATDGSLDLVPPNSDPNNPPGNHVVIECSGLHVILAHLEKGTLVVRVGDLVRAGQRVGSVGNSGNTSEPHLHIHAEDASSRGVPVTFRGRFLVRNSLFRAGD